MESRDRDQALLRDELRALKQRLFEMERLVRDDSAAELRLPDGDFQVLACRVEEERIALLLSDVREVLPVAEMLPIPESPAWMCGMMDLGGHAVPVLDVASRFRRAKREIELSDLVIVCRAEPRDVGLLVQEVFELHDVPRARLSPPVSALPHATYVSGTIRDQDGQLLLLSLARLVSASDLPSTEAVIS